LAPLVVRPYDSSEMKDTAFFGRHRTTWLAVLVLAPAIFGCGSSDRLKKQVSGLETQLTALRADQDRLEERLAAIELSSAVPSHTAPAAAAERVERPRLKIIHLSPDDQEPASEKAVEPPATSAPDSAARRPIIRGTGDRVIKVGDGDSDETMVHTEPTNKRVAELGKDLPRN
jgi:hypothetical protein